MKYILVYRANQELSVEYPKTKERLDERVTELCMQYVEGKEIIFEYIAEQGRKLKAVPSKTIIKYTTNEI